MKRFCLQCLTFLSFVFSTIPVFSLTELEMMDALDRPYGALARINVDGGILYETLSLRAIYSSRSYKPLWFGERGFTASLSEVRQVLLNSHQQGLSPQMFWRPSMERFYTLGDSMSEIEFELSVSEAVFRYARSLFRGQVDPQLVDDDIKLTAKEFTSEHMNSLVRALNGDPAVLAKALEQFEPQLPLYQSLKKQLASRYDEFTQEQRNRISVTMEKLRWLPQSLGDRYAFVNLATTEMKVVENGATVLAMRTVNGRPLRRTPMLIDSMKRVEVNPTWTVPLNLAIWDKLPQIKRDLGFLKRNGIEVYRPGSNTPIEDVASINWNSLSRDYFPYILRQKAGPSNVLGKVKFPLTNGFSIYMHDTDEKNLFKIEGARLRSSGCVRLQKPMEMAAYLLKGQTVPLGRGWVQADGNEYPLGTPFTEEILMSRVGKPSQGASKINTIGIALDKPLPVYMAFLTADIDAEGKAIFVADSYQQDERVLGILRNPGAGTPSVAAVIPPSRNKLVPVRIAGELGPTQLLGSAVAVRCAVWPYKGCVDVEPNGTQTREEIHFRINEEVMLPEGHYILGAENTMLPGWLEVECAEDEVSQCAPLVVNLEKVTIPDEFAQADQIFVFRDMTNNVERNKVLSQAFHNGRALLKQTTLGPKNFYLPGVNQFDVVQRLTLDYCVPILQRKVRDVAPEVLKYCQSLSEVVGMAEYVELPVVINDDNVEGSSEQVRSSRTMKAIQFPENSSSGRYGSQWNQRWVSSPGTWIDFSHRRYLVAAPLFPANMSPEQRFVSVLPGQYQILALDSQGKSVGQKTVRTANIDENYERVARKVILGQ